MACFIDASLFYMFLVCRALFCLLSCCWFCFVIVSPRLRFGAYVVLILLTVCVRNSAINKVDVNFTQSPLFVGDFTLCVCLFVCVCVVVYVYHDVCADDLTRKDWCHTNNILQVHCWGCLVVQVMFHAPITSFMTPQDHRVGQIFKLIYLRQY